ncbi:DUF1684 domain-containing protein [Natrinema altunense]|uniref:DUF1684 domain-containing protein n=1 Tax=Natrinema altunense (strain JCM 12890 / CGMCC 1.3731 / AJ2) TaxID=1227494 RepID=L9ZFS2_NATA2|nr:DUF1684 domain-containing protein [Natrinema altunense]ELY84467.1 hypothetical protein C485_13955 [Natrinema altunense JCM 12890]
MSDSIDVDRWRADLESKRAEKDEFFAEHPQSPIPPDARDGFEGLEYFAPNPTYRVTATATVHDDPEVVLMDTTAGREMRYLRVATLEFELDREAPRASVSASGDQPRAREDEDLDDGTVALAAYRQESPNEQPLFVPFRDKTTGQQTYQGGRYMELEPDRELEDGDEIVVDFNLAYSPFCAYSDTFDCPLPPEENWLEVAIPAGERYE